MNRDIQRKISLYITIKNIILIKLLERKVVQRMATENTIVGILHSPADDETGERKRILIQTTPDNIIDEKTGKTLTQILEENTYSDATESNSGLMSPTYVVNLKALMNDTNVISETNPNKPCMWYQIEEIESES